MTLDKDKITAEALALLNEVGLEGMTTRALAQRLGVKQPALYWHFRDRRALLDQMNAAMMAPFLALAPSPDLPWQEQLFALGSNMRRALLSCRDGALIHAGTRADRGLLEAQMQALTQAGLPPDRAVRVLVAIGRMVVGWVLEEQAEGSIPPEVTPGSAAEIALMVMAEIGEEGAFASGLQMLIAGAALEPWTRQDGANIGR